MTRLHHLALGTADVLRLAAFYREVFGLAEVARHDDGAASVRSVWLDLEGAVLMIEKTDAERAPVQGVGGGWFLVALRVSAEERRRLEAELTARGHDVEARTAFTSYARDPDGNRIAFSHYPEPEAARG